MLAGFADENIHKGLVAALRRQGMDVAIVQERSLQGTDDEALLQLATSEGRLVLSNDTDFLRIHAAWLVAGAAHAGILFWPQTRRLGIIIPRIIQYASQTSPGDAANALVYL